MIVKVIRGSIKFNDTVYTEGQTVELADEEAISIIKSGIAEEYVQEVAPKETKKEKAEEVKEPEVEEPKVEGEEVKTEPTLDWTRKELVAHATALGIENPDELGAKEKILEAIQAKGKEPKPAEEAEEVEKPKEEVKTE